MMPLNETSGHLENIKVAVRLRPFTEKEKQRHCKRIVDIEQNTVALFSTKYGDTADCIKRFTFDHSYWSHDGFKRRPTDGVNVPDEDHANGIKYVSQERVFADLGMFLLKNALDGYNSALLAYGQTGSGKSYTVSGYGSNEGILPRFARELFTEIEKRKLSSSKGDDDDDNEQVLQQRASNNNSRCEVYFSMIEIYNEVVRDLLAKQQQQQQQNNGYNNNMQQQQTREQQHYTSSSIARRGLRVREHPKRGFFVENLSSFPCANKEQIERLIEEGQLNKSIAATSMNETSSRGHTIYEFHIKQYKTSLTPTSTDHQQQALETLTTSVVQLVDLAGSERSSVHVTSAVAAAAAMPMRSSSPFQMRDELATLRRTTGGSTRVSASSTSQSRRAQPSSAASSSSSTMSSSLRARASATDNNNNNQLMLNSNHQQRFKESVSINQSLSALGNCIQVLSQYSQQQQQQQQLSTSQQAASMQTNAAVKIPYRDSVLTKLLNRCCLSGNSKVVLIATLSPADTNYDDTLSTLRFADRAKQIRTHATINRMSGGGANVKLQRENERLKQILDGRVTRSDDSSQTSNFDDTENMLDNFNGPKAGARCRSRAVNQSQQQQRRLDDSSSSSPAPVSKQVTALNDKRKATTNARHRTSTRSTGAGRRVATPADAGGARLLGGSTSNLSLATITSARHDDDGRARMDQLVSPATKKMSRRLGEQSNSTSGMRKSRSVGQSINHLDENDDDDDDEQLREIDLVASGLLDEIDLNELIASIGRERDTADSAGPLHSGAGSGGSSSNSSSGSPASNGSLSASSSPLLSTSSFVWPTADMSTNENMTNEEKINLLNKLLSKKSGVANRLIREQLGAAKQQAQQGARPKAASQRAAEGVSQRVAAMSSSLKKTNPYLSNLNADEQLTGMIAYIIKVGDMIIGKSNTCDLLIYGPELRGRHARITRLAHHQRNSAELEQSEVFIEPILECNNNTDVKLQQQQQKQVALFVNGEPVVGRTKLRHCDRLLFGSNAFFVFVDNASAARHETHLADLDLVTYDMARNEVLRKIVTSDARNEATIKEINEYTHRPGTGKLHNKQRAAAAGDEKSDEKLEKNSVTKGEENEQQQQPLKLSRVRSSRLTRSMTIHDNDQQQNINNAKQRTTTSDATQTGAESGAGNNELQVTTKELDEIKEEDAAAGSADDQLYRGKLMEDTYEFAMPVAEANAIAKEMGVKVTYGLKILTGEEQLLQRNSIGIDQETDQETDNSSQVESEHDVLLNNEQQQPEEAGTKVGRNCIAPATLDLAPDLYVHVHLDELGVDFYWSKEKFSERRVKMLELYGAWDVGGKSGLVEYLIEQSKYQGYYVIDPFVDDLRSTFVLVGHAQVSLAPVCHMSDLRESFDIIDVNDNSVGTIQIEAIPCKTTLTTNDLITPYEVLNERELEKSFVERPSEQLLGAPLVFMLKIVACTHIPSRFERIFCQYTFDRRHKRAVVQTKLKQVPSSDDVDDFYDTDTTPEAATAAAASGRVEFNHVYFVAIDSLDTDVLDFLQHGFLTIQVIGLYRAPPGRAAKSSASSSSSAATSSNLTNNNNNNIDSSQQRPIRSTATSHSSTTMSTFAQPTLVSNIISSINKYRFRMEQQNFISSNNSSLQNQPYASSIYANSLTDSARSRPDQAVASGSGNAGNDMINSAASSVTSATTMNLFDQQQDEDDAINSSLNGISQENIIDMILTKRKLDRAENQLHYLKRTINIAEHYNKKHIPVKTVKKLLSSYGHELEGGSLEEMATEVTSESKSSSSKHSNCTIQ